MSLEPRERGGPIQKFWDEAGTIKQLEQVKSWLMKKRSTMVLHMNAAWESECTMVWADWKEKGPPL